MALKVLHCSYLRATEMASQAGRVVCTGESHMARPHRAAGQPIAMAATCLRCVEIYLILGPRLLPFSGS